MAPVAVAPVVSALGIVVVVVVVASVLVSSEAAMVVVAFIERSGRWMDGWMNGFGMDDGCRTPSDAMIGGGDNNIHHHDMLTIVGDHDRPARKWAIHKSNIQFRISLFKRSVRFAVQQVVDPPHHGVMHGQAARREQKNIHPSIIVDP